MKNLMILLCTLSTLAFSGSLSGQTMTEKRMIKLYENQQYERCAAKAEKLKSRDSRNGTARLYIAKAAISDQRGSSKSAHYFKLKKALREYAAAEGLGIRDRDFYYDELRDEYEAFALLYLKKGDSSKAYSLAKAMLKSMGDTLAFYKPLLLPVFRNEERQDSSVFRIVSEDSLRRILLQTAQALVGVPYVYGGESKRGFDCSGFTKYVYNKIGIELPHNAHMQSELGNHKTLDEAEEGDLVFFGYKRGKGYRAIHAGIIYNNQNSKDSSVVHCVSKGVAIEGKNSSWDRYWKNKVLFVAAVIAKY